MNAQIKRLQLERDILLAAISPADYAKVQARLDAIANASDEEILKENSFGN